MSLPYRQTKMYRGLHKARSVKPKGTYKRKRGRTIKIPRGNQFANQLGGLMKTVPTKGTATTKCHWEGFTNTGQILVNDPGNALTVLSFQLDDSSALGNAVNVFMRYKITEATLLLWPQQLPGGAGNSPTVYQFPQVSTVVSPFKQKALTGIRAGTSNSIGAIQGSQFKVLNTTQDILRCRIFNPRPAIDASTGNGAQDSPVYMPTGQLACTSDGIKIPHFGFAIGWNGWAPNQPGTSMTPPPAPALDPMNAAFGYKICLGVTFYEPRLNTITALDIERRHPLVLEGSVDKDVKLAEAVDTLETLSSN